MWDPQGHTCKNLMTKRSMMLSRLRSEHANCRCALHLGLQKESENQSEGNAAEAIPRDGNQLPLRAAFERPLLNCQRPKGTYKS